MKKQLLKKLSAFIVPIAIMMLFSASANAQIIYTDVNPDVAQTCTASGNPYTCNSFDSIDINNDGVFDLKLEVYLHRQGSRLGSTTSGYVKATPLNGSAITSNNSGYPLHMYRNDSIKSNSNWSTTANQILETVSHTTNQIGNTVSGNWTPPIDGFLGIKIISGGQTNYGWIRLNVTINLLTASYTYKEFAYNSIPNQPILAGQASATVIIAPFVYIPDAAFKSILVNNAAINTDIDSEIQFTEAASLKGKLYISGASISNLTGLEAFTDIDSLYLYYTVVTSLDVTSNTALIYLNCNNNQLTSIDVSGNTVLTELYCNYNQLTNVDLSANTALTKLNCTHNQLTNLNVSNNRALTAMYCYYNQLTSLDVSSNMALSILYTGNNPLTSLNFSNNLEFLDCENNQLTSLDVSANTTLWYLVCNNNQLTSLNVRNGNNINFFYFSAIGNPNLTCIEVDNVAYSNANWSADIDAIASFSTNCVVTSVPDIDKSATVQIIPNPANSNVTFSGLDNIQKIELINMQGQLIQTIGVRGNSSLIDVSSIPNGIYQLKLSSSNQSQIKKLVVKH